MMCLYTAIVLIWELGLVNSKVTYDWVMFLPVVFHIHEGTILPSIQVVEALLKTTLPCHILTLGDDWSLGAFKIYLMDLRGKLHLMQVALVLNVIVHPINFTLLSFSLLIELLPLVLRRCVDSSTPSIRSKCITAVRLRPKGAFFSL